MKPASKRSVVVLAICAVCTLVLLVLWWRGFVPLQELEFFARDWQTRLGRKTPRDSRLVLIGIDKPVYGRADFNAQELQEEPALALLQKNNFPWSRAVWARLIQKLGDAGAKVIVLDLVLPAPGEGDDELRQVLEKYKDRVVIGYNISQEKTGRGDVVELQLPNSSVLAPSGTNSPVEDGRLGYVNIWPDFDDVLRRANYRQTGAGIGDVLPPDVVLESLDARALRKFGRADLIPPGIDPRLFRYTAAPGYGFRPHPVGDVLSPKLWNINYAGGKFFKDKIVLIGPTAEIFHDEHDSPFAYPKRAMAGPEIHLNIINAALHGEFLSEPSMPVCLLIITLAGLIAAILCFLIRQPLQRFLVMTALTAAYWLLAFQILPNSSTVTQVIFVLTPTFALVASTLFALTYDYLLERLEKRRVRKTLERYVSRDVVKELLDNPQTYFNAVGGVRRSITVLFSDVRGFTTLTESADSARARQAAQRIFRGNGRARLRASGLARQIHRRRRHGRVGQHRQPRQRAGRAQRRRHRAGHETQPGQIERGLEGARGMPELAFGIGINHGEVIVGESRFVRENGIHRRSATPSISPRASKA